jgi:hypothetical protein
VASGRGPADPGAFPYQTNIYRATTQSISHDEAVIYGWMLSGPWSQVLSFEHGNHHVVSELLSKLTIGLFGLSGFSLRIPVLLGGLLYFYSVFQISAFLFGEAFLFLLSVAFLCLNPLVLDYLVCARGYGLALGFFFYALYRLARYLAESPDQPGASRPARLLNQAGVALGLSIGCNVIMIFPGAALIVSFLSMLFGDALIRQPAPVAEASLGRHSRSSRKERRRKSRHEASAKPRARSWEQALLQFVLPAVAVGGCISMLPQRLIELEAGYLGPPSLPAILEGLVRFSFLHSPTGFAGLAVCFQPETAIWIVTNLVAPAGLAGLVVVAIRILATWIGKRSFDVLPVIDRFLLLLTGMLPVAIVPIVLSRYVFHQPYPELRTAMYWIPLLSLASLSVLRRFGEGTGMRRILSLPLAAVLVACVLQYVTQFNTRYFAEWAYCAAGKDMIEIVRAQHALQPGTRVRVGATWQLEPVIDFYRVSWGLDWMDPVYRQSPDGSFDYYLLAFGDTSLVERRHLKILLRDRLSGSILAKPSGL